MTNDVRDDDDAKMNQKSVSLEATTWENLLVAILRNWQIIHEEQRRDSGTISAALYLVYLKRCFF